MRPDSSGIATFTAFTPFLNGLNYRRFHGGRRHLDRGANAAKFTVNVGKNRDFDAR